MKNIKLKHVLLVITFTVLLIFLFVNLGAVVDVFSLIFAVLAPIFCGLLIAYILNYPYKFFYEKCFYKIGEKKPKLLRLRKVLAMLCAYIIVFGIITVLLVVLIPQLSDSIRSLIKDIPAYANTTRGWIENTVKFIDKNTGLNLYDQETYTKLISMLTGSKATNLVSNVLSWAFPFALSTVQGAATGIYNWIIGIIISIYLLSSRDKLLFSCRKMIVAYLPKKASIKTLKVCNIANNKCGRFIIGKIIDSMIIGVICFIGMSIFRFDYPVLISVIVGVTNVIPFFGPFLGAIPSAFLLLIINPLECLWFIIFIIILQQFDGNILGPKILGETVGLSGFWILFSVIVGGGLFGVAGMLFGVPVFAVIYSLIEDGVEYRLKKKALVASNNQQLTLEGTNDLDEEVIEEVIKEENLDNTPLDSKIEEESEEDKYNKQF